METLRIPQGHSTTRLHAPPAFAGIDMHDGAHFYLRRAMLPVFLPFIEREIVAGHLILDGEVTADIVVLNRAAWSLARCGVAGTA